MFKKIRSGIFWFLAFLLVVVLAGATNKSQISESTGASGGSLSQKETDCNTLNPLCFGTRMFPSLFKVRSSLDKDSRIEKILTNEIVAEESTVISVIDEVSPAVVSIVVKTVGFDLFSGPYAFEDGIGTGFIVDPDGVIVTNSHVVDATSGEYSVVLRDGTTYEVESIHLDQATDLAVLEIPAQELPVLTLGDSDTLKVGQTAVAIGNALGRFENTVTVGVVSGIARELTAMSGFGENPKTYENVIQTDAALNPGNSGGPLLNSASQVIGINVATTSGAENIGFAIPVNTLKPLLESFFKEGRIIRPYIGIAYSIISEDIARVRRLPEGAFVSRVLPDSPAEEAGVERGDIVLSINGATTTTGTSISSILLESDVGDILTLKVDRAGETLTLRVVLKETPEDF